MISIVMSKPVGYVITICKYSVWMATFKISGYYFASLDIKQQCSVDDQTLGPYFRSIKIKNIVLNQT